MEHFARHFRRELGVTEEAARGSGALAVGGEALGLDLGDDPRAA